MSSSKVTNWGNYPEVEGRIQEVSAYDDLASYVMSHKDFICRGNGRSYGDASLNKQMTSLRDLNQVLNLDDKQALLTCQSGILLSEILELIVPTGLFLPVTPGTKYITLGGAIAADVHGKNHLKDGSLSKYIQKIKLVVSDGSLVECSPFQNAQLFWNTCGGMGLTGVIVEATIALSRIETAYVHQENSAFVGLVEMMDQFEAKKDWKYQVAWLDGINGRNSNMVKGVFSCAEHCSVSQIKGHKSIMDPLQIPQSRAINIPSFFPAWVMNDWSMSLYNRLYFYKSSRKSSLTSDYNTFFYPLDNLSNWNRMYGSKGLIQYQIVFPEQHLIQVWDEFMQLMRKFKRYSYLTVMKRFGPGNERSPLSFPMKGYCLAIDLKRDDKVLQMLEEMDQVLIQYGGRTYLAKDARMSASAFQQGYDLSEFLLEERTYKFQSLQSKRLEITN